MRGLQELTMRLYLDVNLQKKFQLDPNSVLNDFGIDEQYKKYLPRIDESSFCVESFGRRFLVAREVGKRFQIFFKKYLNVTEIDFRIIAQSDIFESFLSSPYFFSNQFGLNHYTNIGKGYENITKFFNYAIGLNFPTQLKEILLTEISAHLQFESKFTNSYPFNEFKKGIFFSLNEKHYLIINNKKLKLKVQPLNYTSIEKYFEKQPGGDECLV